MMTTADLTIIIQDKQIILYTNVRCNHNNDNLKSMFNTTINVNFISHTNKLSVYSF